LLLLDISTPTPVQIAVIPRLLARENLVIAASTGSGKTLAYALPTVQHLVGEELVGYQRMPQRPRALLLVPTRELARQVLVSVKKLGHFSKVSSAVVVGGEDYGTQKTSVSNF
jgi:ATP-dependent RNA helicase SrmB